MSQQTGVIVSWIESLFSPPTLFANFWLALGVFFLIVYAIYRGIATVIDLWKDRQ